ncbi:MULTISPECIES: hypothetical protein [unclassified Psychrobacter]|uniref:hypothetical protein n=1 Tax=unclassified Psychrobacter TaxID=196806 RepID=UPI003FD9D082
MSQNEIIINQSLINEIARLNSKIEELESIVRINNKPTLYNSANDEVSHIKDSVRVGQNWLCLNPGKIYHSGTGRCESEPPFIMTVDKIDVSLRGDMYRQHSTMRGHVQMPKNMADWVAMLPDESKEQCLKRVNAEREIMLADPRFNEPIDYLMSDWNRTCLNAAGVYTIKDLVARNQEWLGMQDSIGTKSLRAIESKMNEQGLYFGMLKAVPETDS